MIKPKVLFLHSNKGITSPSHKVRIKIAQNMGIDIESFCIADYVDEGNFNKLNLMHKLKNRKLFRMYEILEEKFKKIDVLIHYNGKSIHPDFLNQFNFLKIYHYADDPDSTNVMSKLVANKYDIQAISNPSCIRDYFDFGCENVFFWPLGAQFYRDDKLNFEENLIPFNKRKSDLLFIGDSFGIPKYRGVHRIKKFLETMKVNVELSFLYKKKSFFKTIESTSFKINGYGKGWDNGYCSTEKAIRLYCNSMFGLNIHNSIGPINLRLYDLAAFGVCQFCDCKSMLHYVFDEGKEIIGYSSAEELIDLYYYYLKNQKEAEKIANNARKRYLQEYSTTHLWKKLNNYVKKFSGINLL